MLAMSLVVYNEIFGAAIKYFCASMSLLFLSYLPSAISVVTLLAYFFYCCFKIKLQRGVGIIIALLIFYTIYSVAIGTNLTAILAALYYFMFFIIGCLVPAFGLERQFQKQILIWWSLVTFGVLLNSFIDFPWTGFNYEVLGQTFQAGKERYAYGTFRMAGFSRSSDTASALMTLFSLLALTTPMHALKKFAIWVISICAIYLTTQKTMLIVAIIAPLFLLITRFRNARGIKNLNLTITKGQLSVAKIVVISLAIVMIALPLFSTSKIRSMESYGIFTLYSIVDRLSNTWPRAWDLLLHYDIPVPLVLGRGLGGIGAPQHFSEEALYNPADNFFVYMYVTFGISCFIIFAYLVKGVTKWPRIDHNLFQMYYVLTITLFMIGATLIVVEDPTLFLIAGMLFAKATEKRETLTATPLK